jgi:hypothetical protein
MNGSNKEVKAMKDRKEKIETIKRVLNGENIKSPVGFIELIEVEPGRYLTKEGEYLTEEEKDELITSTQVVNEIAWVEIKPYYD